MTDPHPPPEARFITLEGGDGAGKSSQARLLAAALREAGLRVLATREPGGAPGAEVLRTLLLSDHSDWSPSAETLLHFAARAEHVEKAIRPALKAGTWVVCDRYSDSTMAYQGFAQGADKGMILALVGLIGQQPDLTLVLDVSDRVASARLRARGDTASDRYEREGAAFHGRVKQGFRAIAAGDPERCVLIDADGNQAEVHAAILRVVSSRFGLRGLGRRDPQ